MKEGKEVEFPSFELASCPVFSWKKGKGFGMKLANWDARKRKWVFNPKLSKKEKASLKKELGDPYGRTGI